MAEKRRQQVKNYRRIFIFGSLTLFLLVFIFSGGLTALVNLAFLVAQPTKTTTVLPHLPAYLTPPILAPLPSATNNADLTITGLAQKENKIDIFLNDQLVLQADPNDDGQFKATVILEEEENTVYAIAQDFLGNRSLPSEKQGVVFDTEAPELTVDQPVPQQKFSGQENRNIQIRGLTEVGAQLYLNDRLVIVDSGGQFTTTWRLNQGENSLKFRAQDLAGNETEEERVVVYQP